MEQTKRTTNRAKSGVYLTIREGRPPEVVQRSGLKAGIIYLCMMYTKFTPSKCTKGQPPHRGGYIGSKSGAGETPKVCKKQKTPNKIKNPRYKRGIYKRQSVRVIYTQDKKGKRKNVKNRHVN